MVEPPTEWTRRHRVRSFGARQKRLGMRQWKPGSRRGRTPGDWALHYHFTRVLRIQKQIFKNIMSFFNKSIINLIFLFITFANNLWYTNKNTMKSKAETSLLPSSLDATNIPCESFYIYTSHTHRNKPEEKKNLLWNTSRH